MTKIEALTAAIALLTDEANQLALMGLKSNWNELPHRAKVAIEMEIFRLRECANQINSEKLELQEIRRDRSEHLEQIENLGKFVGCPGCTTTMIVSETISLIEKLRAEATRKTE